MLHRKVIASQIQNSHPLIFIVKELEVHKWEDMEIEVFPVYGGFNVHWSDASAEVVIWVQGVANDYMPPGSEGEHVLMGAGFHLAMPCILFRLKRKIRYLLRCWGGEDRLSGGCLELVVSW